MPVAFPKQINLLHCKASETHRVLTTLQLTSYTTSNTPEGKKTVIDLLKEKQPEEEMFPLPQNMNELPYLQQLASHKWSWWEKYQEDFKEEEALEG